MKRIFIKTREETFKSLHVIIIYVVATLGYASLQGYLNAFLFSNIIDSVNARNVRSFLLFLSFYALYLILPNIILTAKNTLFWYIREKINNATAYDIYNSVTRSALIFFEDEEWLLKLKRICGLNTFIGDYIYTITAVVAHICALVSYVAFIWQYVGNFAFIFIFVAMPSLIKSWFFSEYYTKLKNKMNNDQQMEDKYFHILTDPVAQSEAKLFQSGKFMFSKWLDKYNGNFKTTLKADRKFLPIHIISSAMTALLAVIVGLQLFSLLEAGAISIGIMLTLIPFIMNMVGRADNTAQNFGSIFLTRLEYRDVMNVINGFKEPEKELLGDTGQASISLQDVSFFYPNSENEILNKISFEIKPNEMVAIVGVNGAGKSTLMKIMAGLYKPVSGKVLYNQQDINYIEDKNLNEKISFLFQHPIKYPDTFYENIFVSDDKKDGLPEDIYNALDPIFADLLSSDKILVPGFSASRDFSGGQWQKIAFLRSFQKNSNIYFFDEPTAALDPLSEIEMFRTFENYVKDSKTVIIATHRLGLARRADKIIVLDNKNIVGIGNHETLLKECSVYNELYEIQSKWYKK